MSTDFELNSPPVLMAIASLLLLVIGGPIFGLGANAAVGLGGAGWAEVALWVGGTVFAFAYLLFVLSILFTFLTFYLRARRRYEIKSSK